MKSLLLIIAALMAAMTVACGDDDDDGDDSSYEEYIQGIDAVIVRADERFEGEAFEDITTAREGLENVADVFADAAAEFAELEPPADLEDIHEELLERTEGQAEGVGEVAAETPEDVPVEQLGPLFEEEPLVSITADPAGSPLCELKDIADERAIEVGDLGCDTAQDEDDEDDDFEDDDEEDDFEDEGGDENDGEADADGA